MYGHGIIPEHDHSSHRGRRCRAGTVARPAQHDAGRIPEPLPKTHAVAGAAAVRSNCHHHAGGLGNGALKEREMVVLNRIYTRTGDDGTTALGSGERRPKYDLRVSAYGSVDETNATLRVVRVHLPDRPDLDAMLALIQNDLFDLGADLAVPQREGKAERLRLVASQVARLES